MDDALAQFCRREHPRLVGALTLYCNDRATAEDLAQEALARACLHWSRVQGMDAPGAWVHRVAMNLASSALRRKAAELRAHRRAGAGAEPVTDHDVASAVAVGNALAGLRAKQRRVLVLRYYLGFSVEETAGILGLPANTVKTHTRRALEHMRARLHGAVDVEEVPAGA